jgi:hypothetical protein
MPAHRKRFCPKGHDKNVVGRTSTYRCKECARETYLKYFKSPRRKALNKIYKRAQRLRNKIAKVDSLSRTEQTKSALNSYPRVNPIYYPPDYEWDSWKIRP